MKKFLTVLLLSVLVLNAYPIGPKNFNKAIHSKRVVLVKFWAKWCAMCSLLNPNFQQAKKIIGKKALLLEYNVDLGGYPLKKYQITTLPTMILFENGKPVEKNSSILSAKDIADWVLGYVPVNE